MTDQPPGPAPPPVNGSLPESRLVQETGEALSAFLVEALGELSGKMQEVLQPTDAPMPLAGPLRVLTDQLINQLRERVENALNAAGGGMRGAAAPTQAKAKVGEPPPRRAPQPGRGQ